MLKNSEVGNIVNTAVRAYDSMWEHLNEARLQGKSWIPEVWPISFSWDGKNLSLLFPGYTRQIGSTEDAKEGAARCINFTLEKLPFYTEAGGFVPSTLGYRNKLNTFLDAYEEVLVRENAPDDVPDDEAFEETEEDAYDREY